MKQTTTLGGILEERNSLPVPVLENAHLYKDVEMSPGLAIQDGEDALGFAIANVMGIALSLGLALLFSLASSLLPFVSLPICFVILACMWYQTYKDTQSYKRYRQHLETLQKTFSASHLRNWRNDLDTTSEKIQELTDVPNKEVLIAELEQTLQLELEIAANIASLRETKTKWERLPIREREADPLYKKVRTSQEMLEKQLRSVRSQLSELLKNADAIVASKELETTRLMVQQETQRIENVLDRAESIRISNELMLGLTDREVQVPIS